MKPSMTMRASVLAALLFAAGCGSDTTAPATASPSPFVAQVGGAWTGAITLTSVEGSHCVPVTMQVGRSETVSMAAEQSAKDVSARVATTTTGVACTYSGHATLNSFVLDSESCDDQLLVVTCTDGIVRDMKLVGSTVKATVRGGSATGNAAYTYNLFITGTPFGAGSVVANYTYNASRQ